jgi:hypothetical protein
MPSMKSQRAEKGVFPFGDLLVFTNDGGRSHSSAGTQVKLA